MREDYCNAAFGWILERAEQTLFHVASVNRPHRSSGPGVLPPESASSVEAGPGGYLAFNFASRAVQAMVAGELFDTEGMLDEAWERMVRVEKHAVAGAQLFTDLEREIETFLNDLNGMAALTGPEACELALESSQFLFGGPSPSL